MRQLMLLRHAKSSWDDPLADDFDRPLNDRGRAGAKALGDWIRSEELTPDEVLCSAAARTVETWNLLMLDSHVRFSPGLYHAGPDRMLDAIRGAEGKRLMLVAHNPGIASLAAMLARDAPVHPRFGQYPTGGLMVANFDIDSWTDIEGRGGDVRNFLTPHDLGVTKPAA